MVELATLEAWAAQAPPPDTPAWLLPVDLPFRQLPRLDLDSEGSLHLRQGREVAAAPGTGAAGRARAYAPDGRFLGFVVPAAGSRVRVERLFVPGAGGTEPPST